MNKSAKIIFFLVAIILIVPTWPTCSTLRPAHSYTGPKVTQKMLARQKAKLLFELARKENMHLGWDDCLAGKAKQRAKVLVRQGYFEHKNPRTDRNPVWRMVIGCYKCRYAGENLSKGNEPAESIHQAWMESPDHRENIENPRYSLLGVGCHDNVCVALFVGF